MGTFLSRYANVISGVMSGFDRLVFRGVLQPLMRKYGMYQFLCDSGIQLLDFKRFVQETTHKIKRTAESEAHQDHRPMRYLPSAKENKEDLARQVFEESPVQGAGLICTFTTLEQCMTFEYERSADRSKRGLKPYPGKCLHLYKYWLDPQFGFMSGRLQTWFPFNIQICINGREWLAQQLKAHGCTDFNRVRNCFTRIGDIDLAQQLLKEQLNTNWTRELTAIARQLNPLHAQIFEHAPMDYYWSAYQTEWATDISFTSSTTLGELYPKLVRHAMVHFKSPDVMRFLGDKAPGNYTGQVVSSFKHRVEGVRVKHWLRGNSIKIYDKAPTLLRIETTLGSTTDFKVFRPKTSGPHDQLQWLPLRKGVADLHRRAQVSDRANMTYLEALSTIEDTTPCAKLFDQVARPTTDRNGRRVRALRLNDPQDLALLEAIIRGEFAIAGFRNRDIRQRLFPTHTDTSAHELRRLSAKTGRLLRLLRVHGVIHKIHDTTRYRLTAKGQLLTAALFAARAANVEQLLRHAA